MPSTLPAPRKFPCPHCTSTGIAFRRREHLLRHLSSTHLHLKPFGCNVCEKRFGRKDELLRHERMHARRNGDGMKKRMKMSKEEEEGVEGLLMLCHESGVECKKDDVEWMTPKASPVMKEEREPCWELPRLFDVLEKEDVDVVEHGRKRKISEVDVWLPLVPF